MSDRTSLFRVRSLASRPFTRAESLGMMRYSMPSNGGATAPIRIVGSQRDEYRACGREGPLPIGAVVHRSHEPAATKAR